MATIKIDPQTTREIIKDITTSTLSAYQLGHKYKLSKMTIDRIGREHLGTDIYSRREKLAFASLCAQIKEFRDRNYSLTSIADQLGISKSSIFDISKKIKSQSSQTTEEATPAEDNEVQVISIEPKIETDSKLPASPFTTPVAKEEHPAKTERFDTRNYNRWAPQCNNHHSTRPMQRLKNSRSPHGYIKICFKDIQITFNPAQKEAEDVITRILSGINS